MTELVQDARVYKAILRLRNMGLDVSLYNPNPDEVLLFITLDSLAKLIEKRIEYPKKEVGLDEEVMIIHLWRGDNPIYDLKRHLARK